MEELLVCWVKEMDQSVLALQERMALPEVDFNLTWVTDSHRVTEQELRDLLVTLSHLRETRARKSNVADIDQRSEAAEQEQAAILKQQLMQFDREVFTEEAHRLHAEAWSLCLELHQCQAANVVQSAALDDQQGTRDRDDIDSFDTKKPHDAAAQKIRLELSCEQEKAVSCMSSTFIQGRSGTGKTLVLAKRMLHSKKKTKLFITKSSLLRDDVTHMLQSDCECKVSVAMPSWPQPRNSVFCLTWEELQELILAGTVSRPSPTRSRASVSYRVFESEYWPTLKASACDLPPLLVWSEFTTRLRPFGPFMMKGLSLDDYQADDMSAMGFRLRAQDLQVIYSLFAQYTAMKKQKCALDDVDVAAQMQSRLDNRNSEACPTDAIFVDEVQDFSPAELTLLISLCKDADGITMVGDTCQTINPGSSFSFKELVEAFHVHGGAAGRSIQATIQKAKAKVPYNTSKFGRLRREKVQQQKAVAESATSTLDVAQVSWESSARESQILALHYNYRCMKGVADLASSTTHLLLASFPNCADLVIEHSLQEGREIPLYVGLPGADPSACIMGTGSWRIPKYYPVRVVILVRDGETRERLSKMGVHANILTVAEAKGLEFDIVILFGLLASAPDPQVWNLADPKSHESQVASWAAHSQTALSMNDYRLFCNLALAIPELKNLYVAISRAQVGCAILETEDVSWEGQPWEPLVHSWEEAGLVQKLQGETCYKQHAMSQVRLHNSILGRHAHDEMPSLVMMLEQRFSEILGNATRRKRQSNDEENIDDVINTFQSRGLQLFRHALDDTRERWQVFDEAHRALRESRKLADSRLALQLRGAGFHRAVPQWREKILQLESASQSDMNGNYAAAIAMWMQEAMRRRSWRGRSALRCIKNQDVIGLIFSFTGEFEITSGGCFVLERVREHAQVHKQLTRQLVLCRAWHLRSVAENDADRAKNYHENLVRCALQEGSIKDAWGEEDSLVAPLVVHAAKDVPCIMLASPEKLAEAGRAFFAIRRPALAAQTFAEAHQLCACHENLLSHVRMNLCNDRSDVFVQHICKQENVLSEQFKAKSRSYAREAARCFLLVAGGADCTVVSRAEALENAEAHFNNAHEHFMAALCAARRDHFSAAFMYLADHVERDLSTSRLGLVSVALRQVISRADAKQTQASMLAQLFLEPNFAMVSRTGLFLYISFFRLSQKWRREATIQNRWGQLLCKSLDRAGWRYLTTLVGPPGLENRKQFWSSLGLISVRVPTAIEDWAEGSNLEEGISNKHQQATTEKFVHEAGRHAVGKAILKKYQLATWDAFALLLF